MTKKTLLVAASLAVVAVLVFVAYRLGERRRDPKAPSASQLTVADGDVRGLWTHLPLPMTVPLRGISSGSDDAYAVGERGTILRRANGEATWTMQSSPTDRALNAVAQRGAEVFAVGDGVIVERTLGTWKLTREVPGLRGAAYSWMGPIAVGERGAIGVKGPSGWHWETSGTQANLRGVCAGLTEIFAVGEGGVILRYTVGTWNLEPRATTEDLEGIACDDTHAVAVGTGGVVLERKDGVWTRSNSGADPLHGVAATFGMKSWVAVGDKGSVQRSLGGEPASTVGDLFGVTEGPQGELAVGEGGLFVRIH